ncbi:MAG TPA: Gfo/Idh/MocA family oxidoreductase [Ruminiclostridium sp.]
MMKFATIGTNSITDSFIQAAQLCEEFKLSAVYSRSKSRASEYAAKYEVQKSYDSLEGLACDKDIDAVYIASPTSFHAVQAIQMLKAGKHVLCEKPIASNEKELQEILEAAAKAHRVVLEAMRPAFMPGFKAIQDNLCKLGKIRRVTFTYCQYSSRYDKFKAGIVENAFNPAFSNGALMDIGVYCVHVLVKLFGLPQNINADGIILSNGIDGAGTITANYRDFQAELLYSKITNSYNFSEIQGEDACMVIDKINGPRNIKIIYRTGEEQDLQIEPQDHDMRYELQEFIRLVKSGKDMDIYNKNSIITIQIMDQARKLMGIRFTADNQ